MGENIIGIINGIESLFTQFNEEEIIMHLKELYNIIEDTNDSNAKCEYDSIMDYTFKHNSNYASILKYFVEED